MRLVLFHTWHIEFAASGEITIPINYKSAEALLCDFDAVLEEALKNKKTKFTIAGHEFKVFLFTEWLKNKSGKYEECRILPNIYTIDEWFNKYKEK